MERPVRSEQPVVSFVTAHRSRQRIARMQIEWNVEPFDHAPERPVLRQIVIHRGVGRSDLREAVDQGTPETEVLDAALELCRRAVRVLHGQRRNATKRSGRLAISRARMSFASRVTSVARLISGIAWMAGALSDAIMISMPAASMNRSRRSWKSRRRGPSSDHTWAPKMCESPSVVLVAK